VVAGTPGVLYRLRGDEFEALFETETADLATLVVTPAGRVYVGTAPGGEVYRVYDDGTNELFFETGEDYVWSMAYSREHGLLVGTGDAARIYAVDERGSGEVVCEFDDPSVTAIAAFEGRVVAGTAGEGLVVDVTPGSDLRVIYDAPYDEISAVAFGEDGRLYFAATTVLLEEALDGGDEPGVGLGDGAVYGTTDAGGAVELWRSDSSPVTALGRGFDGVMWAGTGSDARLFAIGGTGQVDLVATLDEEEILAISGDGIVVTGAPGAVYEIGDGVARSGVYESEALDASAVAEWGEARWRAELPSGTGISFSTRSGNTAVPDEFWSEWAKVPGTSEGAVASPPGRFLQWKAELEGGGGSSPILRRVEVAFLRENMPPRLGPVVVYDPEEVVASGGGSNGTVSQSLPSGVEVTYSLDPPGSRIRELPVLLRGVRTAEWEASDPDRDRISFDLWIRGEDEDEWKLIEEELRRSVHTWDTLSMSDGTYRLKVVASDEEDNTEESAGSDEQTSAPFLVDNTPPRIEGVKLSLKEGSLTASGKARDDLSPLLRVEVAVDYGEWRPVVADDGLIDSLSESFALRVEDVGAGEHSVAVRAIDLSGNIAVLRKVLR